MVAILAMAAIAVGLAGRTHAATEKVLSGFDGTNGAHPLGNMIFDAAGNLYGVAQEGGNDTVNCYFDSCGTVFEMSKNSNGGWTITVVHEFTGGADGSNPQAGLVMDAAGNLYGTARYGGNEQNFCGGGGCGVVFELSPLANGQWNYTILYTFQGSPDGEEPAATLTLDKAGNLYGTTVGGGVNGGGTVFELSAGTWNFTLLHSFNYVGGSGGGGPLGGVVFDAAGNLYGTTNDGGDSSCFLGCGVVFKLSPNEWGGWTESVIYTFEEVKGGTYPQGNLVFDAAGNLYGSAPTGGTLGCALTCGGVVYRLSPTASGPWNETILFAFQQNANGGWVPSAGVAFDKAGNAYGVASTGPGKSGQGLVFELSPQATGMWKETVLHPFTGADGAAPYQAGVTLDAMGNLYGLTTAGGTGNDNNGVAYEIIP
jgi:uncharacterized repeat protein (TIGR03803 family)